MTNSENNPNKVYAGTQKMQILAYLKEGRTLTTAEALLKFGIYALSQRVGDLIKEGHNIARVPVVTSTGKRIMSYKLIN